MKTPRFSVYRWAECKKEWRIWDSVLRTQVAIFARQSDADEVAAYWNAHPEEA